jgi:soluble lytic murein transglycosylase-like protein
MRLIEASAEKAHTQRTFFYRLGRFIFFIVLLGILACVAYGVNQYQESKEEAQYEYVYASRTLDYIEVLKPGIDPVIKDRIAHAIDREAFANDLPPELVTALIKSESDFNPRAMSYTVKGKQKIPCAYGLMQINPSAHEYLRWNYSLSDLCNIDVNIKEGCKLLKGMMDQSQSHQEALGRYVGSKHGWKEYKLEILGNTSKLYALDTR